MERRYPIDEEIQIREQLRLLEAVSVAPFRSLPATRERRPTHRETRHQPVSFRREAPHIPSTTFGAFGLYRYPAKFIPQAVAYVIDHYATNRSRIIDPFAGSGTTGLTAYLYGLDSELWDLNPLLQHIIEAALADPSLLHIDALIETLTRSKAFWLPEWSRMDYWYPEPALKLLGKVWGYYHLEADGSLRPLLAIPLLRATKLLSYNDPQRQKLSRSPKAIQRVERLLREGLESRFYAALREEMARTVQKLLEYQHLLDPACKPAIRVQAGVDSSELAESLPDDARWDMLITSPPYLQAQEYIRCSKLDLFWLGYPEETIRELAKRELPYKKVEPFEVLSPTYCEYAEQIQEPHLLRLYQHYFFSVAKTLTLLSERIADTMCLFVGQATVRGKRIPTDVIFAEHFTTLGWRHEVTYIDKIEARVMFRSRFNPATGIEDHRMPTEHMVILRR